MQGDIACSQNYLTFLEGVSAIIIHWQLTVLTTIIALPNVKFEILQFRKFEMINLDVKKKYCPLFILTEN